MDNAVLKAEQLTKVFRDFWGRPRVRALKSVDFEIRRGEVFGLLGPNGSGKSTAVKIALGLLRPTSGCVRVFGRSPMDSEVRARTGYMPEESCLYRYLTPLETLEFYAKLFPIEPSVRKDRIGQLLEMMGLEHVRHRVVAGFSKGMARRLVLAQALINDPDLILLDEPTSGLDPVACRQIKDLILTLSARGKTVVLSSHLLADVEDVCHRIAVLHNGRLCAAGEVSELLREPASLQLTVPALEAKKLDSLLALITREVGEVPVVRHPSRTLEQFFLEVTQEAQRSDADSSGVSRMRKAARFLQQ
jgi:ABC-2 type transport system ATP-binding protein